jgi:hypothetical protein
MTNAAQGVPLAQSFNWSKRMRSSSQITRNLVVVLLRHFLCKEFTAAVERRQFWLPLFGRFELLQLLPYQDARLIVDDKCAEAPDGCFA